MVSFSRNLVGSIVLGLVTSGGAYADTLVSVRPGVACTSAEALARLTRPDGSSRSGTADAPAVAREIARRGGCLPFGPGITVFPHAIRRQTSVVTAYALDHTGPLTLYVANIDFTRAAASGSRGAGPVEPLPTAQDVAPDPPASRPAAAHRSLSTGLLSLGMTTHDARRRLAGAFVVSDPAVADDRDTGFVADSRDRNERYEVRSRAGTVFRVTHSVRFTRGRQQVLATLVGRLLARYGTGATVVTLPGAAAGAGVPAMPPQPGWERDWIGRPVVMAVRDSLEDATAHAGTLVSCAQQMAALDPSDAGDGSSTERRMPGPGPEASSCGREVLVRLEPGTIPSVAGRLLVILAEPPAEAESTPSALRSG